MMSIALTQSAGLNRARTFLLGGLVFLGGVLWVDMVHAGASMESAFILFLGSLFLWRYGGPWSRRATPQIASRYGWVWACVSVLFSFASGVLFFGALGWCLLAIFWVKTFMQGYSNKRLAQLMAVGLFMFPWVTVDAWWIEWYARLSAASVSEIVLQWAGFDVVRTGVRLFVSGIELHIASSCAGLNTLEGVLFFGTVLTYYFLKGSRLFWGAFCLLPIIAWFSNIIRVSLLCWVAAEWGPSFLTEMLHQWGGLIILGFLMSAYVALLVCLRTLVSNCYES